MTNGTRLTLSWTGALAAAIVLMSAGALTAWIAFRGSPPAPGESRAPAAHDGATPPATTSSPTTDGDGRLPDIVVPLSREAAGRAGIVVEAAATGEVTSMLRIPGLVEPNAYRQVVVTPLAGGRVIGVNVPLGARVRRGETLARIYSPELAEAHTRLIALRAEFDASERQVNRTRQLVEIGAASRQELEQVHAEHAGHTAAIAAARSRLVLLGMSPAEIDKPSDGAAVAASIDVPAPLDGVVIERAANVGLNVDAATNLFTIVDLATVWVVGDLYERDFPRVRIGSPASISIAAYPDAALEGRISYIDPQISPETRTARVRVEVANPRQDLRLGMLAQVDVRMTPDAGSVTVPREALQVVGDRQVVYLADPASPDRFIEREVQVGTAAGERVQILSGLEPGNRVVTKGSFYLRAERERLGLAPRHATSALPSSPAPSSKNDVQVTRVRVTAKGFEPARVVLKSGKPARVEFVRTVEQTCATEVVIPGIAERTPLPLNQPVIIDLPARDAGELSFACGMDMLTGIVVFEK